MADNKSFVFVNGQKYFIKNDRHHNKYEIIIEKLAKLAGINCAHYHYALKSDSYLSEDLNNLGDFITAKEMGFSIVEKHLYQVWDFFEKNFPLETKKLMDQFILVYLFNFFIMNSDLHSGNWGILTDKEGNHDIYILDNEYSFDLERCVHMTAEMNDETFHLGEDYGTSLSHNMDELSLFIRVSSKENVAVLLNLFLTITPSVFKKVLDEVNLEYTLDDRDLYFLNWLYDMNYDAIKRVLMAYNLVDDFSLK